jgi:hypothetical protein
MKMQKSIYFTIEFCELVFAKHFVPKCKFDDLDKLKKDLNESLICHLFVSVLLVGPTMVPFSSVRTIGDEAGGNSQNHRSQNQEISDDFRHFKVPYIRLDHDLMKS